MRHNTTMLSLFFACMMVLALVPSTSFATVKDIVVDKDGKAVLDSNGGCVRTKWDTSTDKCHEVFISLEERTVYFDFDMSNLKGSEVAKLDALAKTLNDHKITSVRIVGYTDRIGTTQYNDVLSKKRAVEVKKYLDSKVRLKQSVVTLRALGEQNQVKGCHGIKDHDALISCLAPNRRVEVEVNYFDHVR